MASTPVKPWTHPKIERCDIEKFGLLGWAPFWKDATILDDSKLHSRLMDLVQYAADHCINRTRSWLQGWKLHDVTRNETLTLEIHRVDSTLRISFLLHFSSSKWSFPCFRVAALAPTLEITRTTNEFLQQTTVFVGESAPTPWFPTERDTGDTAWRPWPWRWMNDVERDRDLRGTRARGFNQLNSIRRHTINSRPWSLCSGGGHQTSGEMVFQNSNKQPQQTESRSDRTRVRVQRWKFGARFTKSRKSWRCCAQLQQHSASFSEENM